MPNPFSDQAIITLDAELHQGTMIIYDLAGNKVKEITGLSGKQFSIDRDGLSSGMYMYRIFDSSEKISSGKLIVE